jgi:uncharacterized protein
MSNMSSAICLPASSPKVDALEASLRSMGNVVVAFSGGADSAFLGAFATLVLGANNVLCATAVSASLAASEADDCRALAAEWGLNWQTYLTNETSRPEYIANNGDRCFHCKDELMDVLVPIAQERHAHIMLGVNTDDLGDHRPGQQAAELKGAAFPLVIAGLSKAEIRELSQSMGLRTWNKPAAACLASRVPYGTAVTVGLLSTIDRAEAAMRQLGFVGNMRVRHEGKTARIELDASDFARAAEVHGHIVDALASLGYQYITLDLAGFRSGNLNWALGADQS